MKGDKVEGKGEKRKGGKVSYVKRREEERGIYGQKERGGGEGARRKQCYDRAEQNSDGAARQERSLA